MFAVSNNETLCEVYIYGRNVSQLVLPRGKQGCAMVQERLQLIHPQTVLNQYNKRPMGLDAQLQRVSYFVRYIYSYLLHLGFGLRSDTVEG